MAFGDNWDDNNDQDQPAIGDPDQQQPQGGSPRYQAVGMPPVNNTAPQPSMSAQGPSAMQRISGALQGMGGAMGQGGAGQMGPGLGGPMGRGPMPGTTPGLAGRQGGGIGASIGSALGGAVGGALGARPQVQGMVGAPAIQPNPLPGAMPPPPVGGGPSPLQPGVPGLNALPGGMPGSGAPPAGVGAPAPTNPVMPYAGGGRVDGSNHLGPQQYQLGRSYREVGSLKPQEVPNQFQQIYGPSVAPMQQDFARGGTVHGGHNHPYDPACCPPGAGGMTPMAMGGVVAPQPPPINKPIQPGLPGIKPPSAESGMRRYSPIGPRNPNATLQPKPEDMAHRLPRRESISPRLNVRLPRPKMPGVGAVSMK